ncbi:MAG: hypothetical protein D6690_02345 [Nitrospirae bacterium]|nr:MAG: hypothetical protein D6690_02345 [Nitrospirota bacterium]
MSLSVETRGRLHDPGTAAAEHVAFSHGVAKKPIHSFFCRDEEQLVLLGKTLPHHQANRNEMDKILLARSMERMRFLMQAQGIDFTRSVQVRSGVSWKTP